MSEMTVDQWREFTKHLSEVNADLRVALLKRDQEVAELNHKLGEALADMDAAHIDGEMTGRRLHAANNELMYLRDRVKHLEELMADYEGTEHGPEAVDRTGDR
jgi:uncharacterized membrane protein